MLKLEKLEKVLGKDLTDKLRKAFDIETPPAVTEPIVLTSSNLKDGSGVIVGTIAIGEAVTMNDAPVVDGTYVLESGDEITCAGGLITAVTPAEPTEQPMSEAAVLEAIQTALTAQAEVFNGQIKTLTDANATLVAENKTAFNSLLEGMELIAELKATAPEPKNDPKNKFAAQAEEGRTRLQNIVNKLKTTTP